MLKRLIRYSVLGLVLFNAAGVLAGQAVCAGDGNGECIKIDVTAPKEPPSGGGDGGNGNESGSGDRNVNSVKELPKNPSGEVEWLKVFKTVKDFCKKPNESCSPAWTTRMTAGAPGVRAICQQVGIAIQGTCNAEVAYEASFGCPNVSDC